MTQTIKSRHKFIAGTAVLILTLPILLTPSGRNVAVSALADFTEIVEGVARFPCWLVDHSRRFPLDRLDPTCPQCI